MASSSWMFGGGNDATASGEVEEKRTFFNRDWANDNYDGLQIGTSNDKQSQMEIKRAAQREYYAALDADKQLHNLHNAHEAGRRRELDSASQEGAVDWQGRSVQVVPPPARPTPATINSRNSVAAMIAQESSPLNSPRRRNKQELDSFEAASSAESASEFCIGEPEVLVKQRRQAAKQAYLSALDADNGYNRETISRAPRAARDPYEVSTGITGFNIGANTPSLDMSPSMKSLFVDAKRAKQEAYRALLAQQQTHKLSKSEQLLASAAAATNNDAPPYMRY